MKVRNPFSSISIVRGFTAVAIAWTLAAAGAAPLTAVAETTPVTAPVASSETTGATSVEGTITASADTSTTLAEATPTPVAAPVAVKAKKKAKKLTVRQIVAKTGRARGLSKREIDALLWICKRESNFHPTSHSRSECHGLFQLSAGMAHGHPWKNPAWNTKRAIRYMKGRYGGVLKAKAFWSAHHWY